MLLLERQRLSIPSRQPQYGSCAMGVSSRKRVARITAFVVRGISHIQQPRTSQTKVRAALFVAGGQTAEFPALESLRGTLPFCHFPISNPTAKKPCRR